MYCELTTPTIQCYYSENFDRGGQQNETNTFRRFRLNWW